MEIPAEWSDQQAKQAWLKDGGLVLEPGVDWGVLEEANIVPDPNWWKWITGQQSTADYHQGMEAIRERNRSRK